MVLKLAALVAALPAAAAAMELAPSKLSTGPGFVRYPVTQRSGAGLWGKHSKRQEEVGVRDRQSGSMYTIDITLGTPGQTVSVQFDTGSSELWVNPVCANGNDPALCSAQQRFTESTTLMDLESLGEITYGAGYTKFEYVADYVDIGSVQVSQQIFGVAYDSSFMNVGMFGAGPSIDGWQSEYPFVLDSMVTQGLINSRAFAMDLKGFEGIEAENGAVIFGGLDKKKFTGHLQKLPVVNARDSPDGKTRWWVRLDGLAVTAADGKTTTLYASESTGRGQALLLDSGYTLSAFPTPIFNELLKAFPAAKLTVDGLYELECPPKGAEADHPVLSFTFDKTTIDVPLIDFVWHAPGVDFCVLGAYEDDFPVLGDTFLRGAYAVYDWDNRDIYLAQSADCGTEIVAIEKGEGGVPVTQGSCGSSSAGRAASEVSDAAGREVKGLLSSMFGPASAGSGAPKPRSAAVRDRDVVPAPYGAAKDGAVEAEEPCETIVTTQTSGRVIVVPVETGPGSDSGVPCDETTTQTSTHTSTHTVVLAKSTPAYPETTATYTIPRVITCRGDSLDCPSGSSKTVTGTVTVRPAVTQTVPATVPGCSEGAPPPKACSECAQPQAPRTTLATMYPTGARNDTVPSGTEAVPSSIPSATGGYPGDIPSVPVDSPGGPETSAPVSTAAKAGITHFALCGAIGGLMMVLAL